MNVSYHDLSLSIFVIEGPTRKLVLHAPDDEGVECLTRPFDKLDKALFNMPVGFALLCGGRYVAERSPSGLLRWAQIVELDEQEAPTLEEAAAALRCVFDHVTITPRIKLQGKLGGFQ